MLCRTLSRDSLPTVPRFGAFRTSWVIYPRALWLAHLGMEIASTWEMEARQHRAGGAAKPAAFSALISRATRSHDPRYGLGRGCATRREGRACLGHTGWRRRVAEPVPVGAQLDARWKARSEKPSERDPNRPWHRKHTAVDGAARSHCSATERHSRLCSRPTGGCLRLESVLLRSQLDYNKQEIQPPEIVTWEQLVPGLPPNGRAVYVMLTDVLEGPLRGQLMSPASVLLPEKLWPPVPPKAKMW